MLLALGYNAIRSWQAASAFEDRLTRLRDAGVPLTMDQLQADPLAEDENAQTWIKQAQPATDKLAQLLEEYHSSDEFRSQRPNEEQIEMLRRVIAEYEDTFELYARAAACSTFRSDWRIGTQPSASMNALLGSTSATRAIERNCAARAGLLLADGDVDQALEQGLQMLSLSRSVEYQPMVVGYLVALACRSTSLKVISAVLERGTLTEQQRKQVDIASAECESVEGYQHALVSERIYGLAAFRTEIFGGPQDSMFLWRFKLDACDYLDLIADMEGWTKSPRHEIGDELDGVMTRKYGPLTMLSVGGLTQVRTAHDRSLAHVRCVRLLNALQQNHPDGLPGAAGDLALPKLAEALKDPFTGSSLKVAITEDAVVVYSVGSNGTDDGGKLDDQSDIGVRIVRRITPTPGQE